MTTAVVTAKGQIVIPSAIRRHLNIKKGTKLCVIDTGDKIVLQPLTREYFEKAAGFLGRGKKLTKAFLAERALEKEHEDKKWKKATG